MSYTKKYPELKKKLKLVHIKACFLHAYGFYEGVYYPEKMDVKEIKEGVRIIESILNKR